MVDITLMTVLEKSYQLLRLCPEYEVRPYVHQLHSRHMAGFHFHVPGWQFVETMTPSMNLYTTDEKGRPYFTHETWGVVNWAYIFSATMLNEAYNDFMDGLISVVGDGWKRPIWQTRLDVAQPWLMDNALKMVIRGRLVPDDYQRSVECNIYT